MRSTTMESLPDSGFDVEARASFYFDKDFANIFANYTYCHQYETTQEPHAEHD